MADCFGTSLTSPLFFSASQCRTEKKKRKRHLRCTILVTSPSNLLFSKDTEHPVTDNNGSSSLFFPDRPQQHCFINYVLWLAFFYIKELSWRLSFSCRKVHLKQKMGLCKEHNTIMLFYGHGEQEQRTLLGGFRSFASPKHVSCKRERR